MRVCRWLACLHAYVSALVYVLSQIRREEAIAAVHSSGKATAFHSGLSIVVSALGNAGLPSHGARLGRLTRHASPDVAAAAVTALRKLAPQDTSTVLATLLEAPLPSFDRMLHASGERHDGSESARTCGTTSSSPQAPNMQCTSSALSSLPVPLPRPSQQ